MKKYLISGVIVSILILLIGIQLISSKEKGIYVKLINNTELEVEGLYITYTGLKNPIEIPKIESEKIYETKIDISELEGEGNMELTYLDKLGNEERIIIVGYFERGYRGNIEVTIKSQDNNGKFDIQVNESTFIF